MIKIIAVGKIKESFFADAISEYKKRLSRYAKLEIIEVADEPCTWQASEAEKEIVLKKEGERILKSLKGGEFIITLEIAGASLDSVEFSEKLNSLFANGSSDITFIIGGSLGLSRDVLKSADFRLSFSKMTFPHNLMRVILLEQLYRAFRIMKGEPYHK